MPISTQFSHEPLLYTSINNSYELRTASSAWIQEHKSTYDPAVNIDETIFDEISTSVTDCLPTDVPFPTFENESSTYDLMKHALELDFHFEDMPAEQFRPTSPETAMDHCTASIPVTKPAIPKSELEDIESDWEKASSTRKNQPTCPAANRDDATDAPMTGELMKTEQKDSVPAANKKSHPGRIYVSEIQDLDVLCGKGGFTNRHLGNLRYRNIVNKWKSRYLDENLTKQEKTKMSWMIVDLVMSEGSRFLKKDTNGKFYEMTRKEARRKTVQSCREKREFRWTSPQYRVAVKREE